MERRRSGSISPKSPNEWLGFLKRNRGSGKSIRKLSQEYRSSKSPTSPRLKRRRSRSRSKSPIEEKIPSSGLFGDLPEEITAMILSGISYQDLLSFCQTRKEYRKFCHDDYMWKLLYKRDFPRRNKRESTYRNAYMSAAIPKFNNWFADRDSGSYRIYVRFYADLHIKINKREYERGLISESQLKSSIRKRIPSGDKWDSVILAHEGVQAVSARIVDYSNNVITDANGFMFRLGKPDKEFGRQISEEFLSRKWPLTEISMKEKILEFLLNFQPIVWLWNRFFEIIRIVFTN